VGDSLAAWRAAGDGADEAYVDDLWPRVLRRPVRDDERQRALAELRLGVSRAELLHRLAVSAEFEEVRLADDAVSWAAAERRHGRRPRNLRAPAGSGPEAIAVPWCLARLGDEQRVLLLAEGAPALEAELRRVAETVLTEPAPEVELVVAVGAVDPAAVAPLLARDGRVLAAAPALAVEGSGLLVYEEERYAPGEDGWRTVDAGEALRCAELRPDRLAVRVRRAVGRGRAK
jgi:hypothetical protein